MTEKFNGRLGIIQRVLPHYRIPFFDLLAEQCNGGLSLFAGQARSSESIFEGKGLKIAKFYQGRNLHLFSGSAYLCYQLGLETWLRQWNPDVLIVEANPRYLSSRAAMRWMKKRGRPIVAWGLGSSQASSANRTQRVNFRKKFLSSFDAIIAYSQAGAESYAQLGIDPQKISVAPNAIIASQSGTKAVKRKVGKARNAILFVGRLQARKGVDRLIRACTGLPAELQPSLDIVGEGPERQRLTKLASHIYPSTSFHGALFDEDLNTRFLAADLFVLPGTGGLAIQQAMSFGLPIIAGEGDGTQQDLVNHKNGWTLTSIEVQELSDTLSEALADQSGLRKKGEISYKRVQSGYNLEIMTEKFIETINKVIH